MPITMSFKRAAAASLAAAAVASTLAATLPAAASTHEVCTAASKDIGFAKTEDHRGDAHFAAHGELLYVDDFAPDGLRTKAELQSCVVRYDPERGHYAAWTTRGWYGSGPRDAATGNRRHDLAIPERVTLRLRTCEKPTDAATCGDWQYGAA